MCIYFADGQNIFAMYCSRQLLQRHAKRAAGCRRRHALNQNPEWAVNLTGERGTKPNRINKMSTIDTARVYVGTMHENTIPAALPGNGWT